MNQLLMTALAASTTLINPNIPGPEDPSTGPIAIIANVYNFALIAGAIIAFAAIVWGAIERITGQGNTSKIIDANDRVTQAFLGLALLAAAYLILYIVNPRLTKLEIPQLPTLPTSTASSGGLVDRTGGHDCSDDQKLAQEHNNAAYPYKNSQRLTELDQCIRTNASGILPRGSNLGSAYTWDRDVLVCNYTRGDGHCAPTQCSHRANSCHYGGRNGTDGAEAVDYGNEQIGGLIIDAAIACGANPAGARCENEFGQNVGRTGSQCNQGATHVHVSSPTCDTN